MLYELLLPSLPMLFTSLAIALASSLIKGTKSSIGIQELLEITVVIYGSLNILQCYAPKVYNYALQGVGTSVGLTMTDSHAHAPSGL